MYGFKVQYPTYFAELQFCIARIAKRYAHFILAAAEGSVAHKQGLAQSTGTSKHSGWPMSYLHLEKIIFKFLKLSFHIAEDIFLDNILVSYRQWYSSEKY